MTERVVEELLLTDALTGNSEGTPDLYHVHPDNLSYLVETILDLVTWPRTLGELSGADLGREIAFTDGGATYRGILASVKHDLGFAEFKRMFDPEPQLVPTKPRRLMVVLRQGSWSHVGYHDADLELVPGDVRGTDHTKETGDE